MTTTPHTCTTSGTTPATHARNAAPGTNTRYFDWLLAYETEQAAYARYLPVRADLYDPSREGAMELWLEASDEEAEAYQAYVQSQA